MITVSIRLITSTLFVVFYATATWGTSDFPLEPPDVSSPRATMESFIRYSEAYYKAISEQQEESVREKIAMNKAILCFDLSDLPPRVRVGEGREYMLQLFEIFSRMTLPDLNDIPGEDTVRKLNTEACCARCNAQRPDVTQWRIPHTEITIGKVTEGDRAGAFLFTPQTVKNLHKYYDKVRKLPYRDNSRHGIYEMYIYSSGWLIPDGLISALPDWMKLGYKGQAVWQWIGLMLTIMASGFMLWSFLYWYKKGKNRFQDSAWGLSGLIVPLYSMGICFLAEYILDYQINITGEVLNTIILLLEFFIYILTAWAVLVAGNIIRRMIISSRHISEEALDADVIKLVCSLISIVLVLALCFQAFNRWGFSLNAVFASAGIAGLAVALAARETLANFFGGISIFLDRPFRTGDYIVLDSGERGEIKAVGMRSTRLQTRDDIMITIPNSIITNVKIVNQSTPKQNFRIHIKVGVAYNSDLEKVEETLVQVALDNPLACRTPPPKVRLRTFGEYAINYELLSWAIRPHDRGRLTHELSKEIHKRFKENGIEIPLPQRVVQLQHDKVTPTSFRKNTP